MKCPFASEFGKWIECINYEKENDGQCADNGEGMGHGGSWCTSMIGKAMLAHKTWIGNDY